jgi:hypothetical protein
MSVWFDGERDSLGLPDVQILAESRNTAPVGRARNVSKGWESKVIGASSGRVAARSSSWTDDGIRTC